MLSGFYGRIIKTFKKEESINNFTKYTEAVVRTVRDSLLVLNSDFCVCWANEAFYDTFKTSVMESDGRSIFDLGNGQWNIPALRALLEDILPHNGSLDDFEVVHDFNNLGIRTMLFNASTLKDDSSQPTKILLSIKDNTKRMKLRAAINRSETRYRRLFEAARDGVLIMDPLTRKIIDANPFITELLGYTYDELLGKELFEIGLLKDDETSRAAFLELQEKGSIRYEDLPLVSKTGQLRQVEMVSNCYNEDGKQIIQCNIRSIAERKEAERVLRESEERYRTLFDFGSVGIYSCASSGVIQKFNKYAVELWGREPALEDTNERFCGAFKLFRPDGSFMPHEYCPMADVLSGKVSEVHDAEAHIERPDGSRIAVIVNIRPLKNERGEITGAINCFYDITERKQAEKLLKAEKRKADVANKAKTEFLANMSHEIRTPMNAVLGLANILAINNNLTNEKYHEIVSTLQLSAQSLLRLINDLLDIAKIETNSIDLEHIPFTFDGIISEVIGIFSEKVQEKGIALYQVDSSLNCQQFFGDPLRIRQILTNLISNAIKFTERGEVTVSMTISPGDEPGDCYVHIAVSDTGIGIAPNKLERVFDKFIQGDASTTRKYGGTGLGLAISKNLAEIMGGSITIKSKVDKGSEFILHLPLELADEASDHIAIAQQHQQEMSVPQTMHGSVLLVEDYKPNVLVATLMLESLGYYCDTANNGKEALEIISANRDKYLTVLMDVQMPIMDGYEATKIIRKEEKAKGLPRLTILAMTAHALSGDREKCLKAGMDDYISKPFIPKELEEKLERLRNRKQYTLTLN